MIAAIVLAAGQAVRFGRCKQLIRLGDKMLLEHVLANVNASTVKLNRLVDVYRDRKSAAVIPTYRGKRGHPVIVDKSLFAEMLALRGDAGFRTIFAKHPDDVVTVAADDAGIVTDIDTREDFDDLAPR